MSEEKKIIVRDLGFGGLMHIPPLRVHHQVLRELANNFKLGENRLETRYDSFKITPRKIGDALGINATGDLFPQKVDYKKLSEDDKVIFRRFQGKTLKSLTDEMMDIGVGNEEERLMKASSTSSSETETTDSDSSTSESETQEDSEDSPRKQPSKKGKKMDSKKKKKSQEDSDSDSESESSDESEESSPVEKQKKKKKTQRTPKKKQSKKKKVVVEHSSPEEDQYNDGYSTSERYEIGSEDLDELLRRINEKSAAERIPDVNLGSDDPSSQGCTEQSSVNKPAESMLSPVQQSASEPAESNMMVVREQTPSEALAIVSIQVFVPVSQTTTVPEFEETPETDFEPTPLLQIEGTTKIYPAAEDAAALLMMARTTPYAPRTDQMPSFSLDLTDSSQEEASTQEGASTQEAERAKSPEAANLLEQLDNLVQKIARNAAKEESKSPQIQRETGGESSGRLYLPCASSSTRQMIKGFKNKYTVPPDIVNMTISKHPNGEFISPKTNKEFRVEDYPSFIPFIDAKKLTSHPYIFAPVCHADHWWLWVIDTRKRRFHILDPLHKKAPSDQRKQLNKFTGYVISRMRAYVGGEPLKKGEKEKEIKASYVKISGQKSIYDCAIYDEVDHYRVEYTSRILFNEMSKERDEAIRASNAIRLSKPSSVLLSPFCQINSTDIENV
ncbi:hypothetical protein Ahy_A03g014727 [Arachis hypogaea]|uniref:Ubiquitin-like protease family profile domain-containing protein n=1 Tax=Arachis hypogaea TaxID=3818 RepID=A0A445DYF1_ARAHY|nr:hypothetical protein Ahy_A03g014727 [Arachis hypogaea]